MGAVCSCLPLGGNEALENVNDKSAPTASEARRSSIGIPSRHDECTMKESVYYDARQSATESMVAYNYTPASLPNYIPRGSVVMEQPETLLLDSNFSKKRRQTILITHDLEEPLLKVDARGYPGNLNPEELEACLDFRRALKENPDQREVVTSFSEIEEEPYALCRYLRARNFNTQDTLEMIDASMSTFQRYKRHDFYPTIEQAVGCPGSVLLTQYPYLFSGNAKNGCPVNYQMIGRVKMEGVACVTELDYIANYVMHSIMYQFTRQIKVAQEKDSSRVVRTECVAVIDLKGLDTSQLNKTTLNTLKSIGAATSCFPEMLNRMIVLNAGYTFSFFWTMIKAFLEARTAAKIEIYTKEKKGKERLLELVEKSDLLKDYGGSGPSFDELAAKKGSASGATRQTAQLMTMNGASTTVVELKKHEKATVSVYTRSEGGVSLSKRGSADKTVQLIRPADLKSDVSEDPPFCTEIAANEMGPGKLNVTAKPGATATPTAYLVV